MWSISYNKQKSNHPTLTFWNHKANWMETCQYPEDQNLWCGFIDNDDENQWGSDESSVRVTLSHRLSSKTFYYLTFHLGRVWLLLIHLFPVTTDKTNLQLIYIVLQIITLNLDRISLYYIVNCVFYKKIWNSVITVWNFAYYLLFCT